MDTPHTRRHSPPQDSGKRHNPEFQALVENTPDLILQVDPTLHFRYVNSQVTQEIGIPSTHIIGKTLFDLGLPTDIVACWQAAIQRVLTTREEQQIEFDLPTLSGAIFWYARVVPEFGTHGQVASVLLISRDVTRLKLAELALRQSESRYRAMIEDQVELVCRFRPDGSLTFVNDACCRFLGRDRTSLMGTSLLQWVAASDQARLEQWLADLNLGSNMADSLEVQVQTGVGTYRWIQWSTKTILDTHEDVVEHQTVGRDIHERKHMEAALRQRIERERTLNRVIQVIRNSLDLTTIFSTATQEIALLLQVDRAAIFQYLPETEVWLGRAEYCLAQELAPVLRLQVSGLNNPLTDRLKRAEVVILPSLEPWLEPIAREWTERFSGRWLMVPLQVGSQVWGALCLNHSETQRPWKDSEGELACIVADQLAIAIQQSQLYAEVQHLNASLERQVRVRTVQLQLAYDFEATLKRITDRVRDSLEEDQILQTAVKELALGMGVMCCNAALFNLEQGTSTIRYEYTTTLAPSQGRVSPMGEFPEIYAPLLEGHYFQFCSILENPVRDRVSMLACPIQDNHGVLGGLWLIGPSFHAYSDQDIRLVQQVANHCAIAIRQARLYQTAQTQVTELERLNSLKDDFLSTVSHELRTPMANVKIAAQMLDLVLTRTGILDSETRQQHPELGRYFRILHDECQREISLINDLLDLSRLDAGTEPLVPTPVNLADWIPSLAHGFRERACAQQQTLTVQLAPDLPILVTDLSYLERILSELLNNACKYTPPGERISLDVQVLISNPSPPALPLFPLPAGSVVQFQLTNTGVEIAPEECDRIFEKFYRIPQHDPWRHGGTGLGLALVKKLTEQLGGSIQVESCQNQTHFVLRLPTAAWPEDI